MKDKEIEAMWPSKMKRAVQENHRELDELLRILCDCENERRRAEILVLHRTTIDRLARNLLLFPELPVSDTHATEVQRRVRELRGIDTSGEVPTPLQHCYVKEVVVPKTVPSYPFANTLVEVNSDGLCKCTSNVVCPLGKPAGSRCDEKELLNGYRG